VASPHTPFAVINRTVNPVVRALLRSPAHGLVSGHLALITVTGRRSGRTYTFPVGYHRDGDVVTIGIDWPDRKRWWRNLREPAPVEIRLRGVRRTGTAQSHGDERSGVTVEIQLDGASAPA
jgi:deazaflavin-dependent oxidoreductase (nitroreductase family)